MPFTLVAKYSVVDSDQTSRVPLLIKADDASLCFGSVFN